MPPLNTSNHLHHSNISIPSEGPISRPNQLRLLQTKPRANRPPSFRIFLLRGQDLSTVTSQTTIQARRVPRRPTKAFQVVVMCDRSPLKMVNQLAKAFDLLIYQHTLIRRKTTRTSHSRMAFPVVHNCIRKGQGDTRNRASPSPQTAVSSNEHCIRMYPPDVFFGIPCYLFPFSPPCVSF